MDGNQTEHMYIIVLRGPEDGGENILHRLAEIIKPGELLLKDAGVEIDDPDTCPVLVRVGSLSELQRAIRQAVKDKRGEQ